MIDKITLPEENYNVPDYDEKLANKTNEIVEEVNGNKNYMFNRLVPDNNGWTVIEYPNKWTEISKIFFVPGITFNSIPPFFARTIENAQITGGMNFPYNFSLVKEVVVNGLVEGGNNINAWPDNIVTTKSNIDRIRFMSIEQTTRDMRFSVTVRGFRP